MLIQVNLLVLVRVGLGLGIEPRILGWALVVEGVLNMTVGNSMALVQTYGKRMLAYSSIAQTGYVAAALGLGLVSGHVEMLAAAFYLIAAHALLKGLAFLSKGVCHYYMDSTMLSDLDGLMDRAPRHDGSVHCGIAGAGRCATTQRLYQQVAVLAGRSAPVGLAEWHGGGAFCAQQPA